MNKIKFEKLSDSKFKNLTNDQMENIFGGAAPKPGDTCGEYTETEGGSQDLGSGGSYTYSNDWQKGDKKLNYTDGGDMSCNDLTEQLKNSFRP